MPNTGNDGYTYKDWYISPKYSSLKNELLQNKIDIAILDDGLIDIIFVSNASKLRVLKIFTQLFSGTHIKDPHVEYSQVISFAIETENDPLNIDGENTGATPIKVELINKAVRIFGKI